MKEQQAENGPSERTRWWSVWSREQSASFYQSLDQIIVPDHNNDVQFEPGPVACALTQIDPEDRDEGNANGAPVDVTLVASTIYQDFNPRKPPPERSACCSYFALATCTAATGLALLVLLLVPWFVTDVEPALALQARLEKTQCVILGHTIIDTRDGARPLAVPGLPVVYWIDPSRFVLRNGNKYDESIHTVALPCIEEEDRWMDRNATQAYFERYPVNSTQECYYDPDDPVGLTSMTDDAERVTQRLAIAIGIAVFASVSMAIVSYLIGRDWLHRRRQRQQS